MYIHKEDWAMFATGTLSLGIFSLGLYTLTLTDITLFRHWFFSNLPPAPAMLSVAFAIAWFRVAVAKSLLIMTNSIHNALSALLMMLVFGSETIMHVLNLPHVEGWWLTIVGSGAVATAISLWHHKFKGRKE